MGVTVQIPDVPEDVHRRLESRAVAAGLSLPEYLLREVIAAAEQPSLKEWLERLRQDPPTTFSESPTEIIRAERDRR